MIHRNFQHLCDSKYMMESSKDRRVDWDMYRMLWLIKEQVVAQRDQIEGVLFSDVVFEFVFSFLF